MAEQTNLSVQVQLNAGDMYRFSMTTVFRRFRWFMLFYGVLAVYLVFQFSREDFHWSWSWGNVFAPLFFFFLFPYAFFVAPYFSSRKYLRKNPNLRGPFHYVFSNEGTEVSGPHSQGHLNWEAIVEVRETSAQFLLYPQTAVAHVIPKRLLATRDQQAALRDLIRTHAKKAKLRG